MPETLKIRLRTCTLYCFTQNIQKEFDVSCKGVLNPCFQVCLVTPKPYFWKEESPVSLTLCEVCTTCVWELCWFLIHVIRGDPLLLFLKTHIYVKILIMKFSGPLTFLHTVYVSVSFSEPLEMILKASVTQTHLLIDRHLQSVQPWLCVEEKSGTKFGLQQ